MLSLTSKASGLSKVEAAPSPDISELDAEGPAVSIPNTPRSEGPFSDPKEESNDGDASSLSKVIQQATKAATSRPISGLGARTPFGDENATE